ncbi:MAG: sulfur oxidation c-type cytochrome SoxA [Thiotrichaceae bacterium]
MRKILTIAATTIALSLTPLIGTHASPAEDLEAFKGYFKKKFSDVAFDDYKNGVYAIDSASREQWEEMEEFPPYELAIDDGAALWGKKFANGKSFADCFGDVAGIRGKYPYFDEAKDDIATLEGTINKCLTDNGEKPFKWKKGNLAKLSAYIAYQGRGGKVDVKVEGAKAEAWYNEGKTFFYAKRGQLNMACADCHVYYAGQNIRADKLSPAMGHTTHFPVYRSKWGNLGTLHRRYGGCNKQVRAKPFKAQSKQYKALEYFEAYMSNGLELNGPGSRK